MEVMSDVKEGGRSISWLIEDIVSSVRLLVQAEELRRIEERGECQIKRYRGTYRERYRGERKKDR